jgi:[ribosomal protein S5]-alanine N-acetyltransferase
VIELQSRECIVRSYRPGDAASLAKHGNNRRIWENLRDRFPHPFTEAHAAQYIEQLSSSNDEVSFAIEVEGEAVGGISLRPGSDIERIGAELGYWLGEAFWNRGITTAAIRLVTDYALNKKRFERVFAIPFTTNVASCRALEKAGYDREGTMRRSAIKDGRIMDQYLYARVRTGR